MFVLEKKNKARDERKSRNGRRLLVDDSGVGRFQCLGFTPKSWGVNIVCLGTCIVVVALVLDLSRLTDTFTKKPPLIVTPAMIGKSNPFLKTDFGLECGKRAIPIQNVLFSVATVTTIPLVMNMMASLICTNAVKQLVLVAADHAASQILTQNSISHVLLQDDRASHDPKAFRRSVEAGKYSEELGGSTLVYLEPGNVFLAQGLNNVKSPVKCFPVQTQSTHVGGHPLCAAPSMDETLPITTRVEALKKAGMWLSDYSNARKLFPGCLQKQWKHHGLWLMGSAKMSDVLPA